MTHKNEALYKALKDYVPAGINELARIAALPILQMSYGSEANFYARLESHSDLAKLPEYQHCLEVLISDPIISRQLGAYIGTQLGGGTSDSAEVLMKWLPDLGMPEENLFQFDPEHFEYEYQRFEDAFYSPNVLFEAVGYLQGLLIEESVKLSDNLELSLLKNEEINANPNLKTREKSGDPTVNQLCAIRTWYSLPKVASHAAFSPEEFDEGSKTQHQANARVDEVINALRLFGIENVYYHSIIHLPSRWLPIGAYNFPSKYLGMPMLSIQSPKEWGEAFRQFWLNLQAEGVKKRRFLDIAIRRFSYGHERPRLEDKIIDLLIAAEALFMSDFDSNNKYVGELRYRLSERAGLFIGGHNMAECRNIFRHMRAAYDLRSSIVHGSAPDTSKFPKKQDESRMNLEEFVWTIQEYIRIAIRKSIDLALQPNSPKSLVNWDELIFSKKEVN